MRNFVFALAAIMGVAAAAPAFAQPYGHPPYHCHRVWHHHHSERVCR